jgi:hypothetical protein
MPASRAQRAKTAQRRTEAIKLRLAGVDYDTIAARLGYASRGAACTDINRALEQAVAEQTASADVLRHEELQRLDRLQAGLWTAAAGGDTKAVDSVLRIIDRRCKLLGLDAPQRHEVITMDAVEAEIKRLTAEMDTEELRQLTDELTADDPAGD